MMDLRVLYGCEGMLACFGLKGCAMMEVKGIVRMLRDVTGGLF